MNNSAIEWCDRSFNPITGCLHGCTYCYAAKQARRFAGDIRLNKASQQLRHLPGGLYELDTPFKNIGGRTIPLPVGFEPTFHKYRLSDPAKVTRKSLNIFVGSMADCFGEWVPDRWLSQVFDACAAAPWHQYMFLTKNPKGYHRVQLPDSSNMWYGTSITRNADLTRIADLPLDHNRFLSIEPLQEAVDLGARPIRAATPIIDWVIIGAETITKGRVVPQPEWVENIVAYCRRFDIPVFEKDSLEVIVNRPLYREFPQGLQPRPEPRPLHRKRVESVREKKYCNACGTFLQGKPAVRLGARRYECIPCFDRLEAESWQIKQSNKRQ